VKGGAGSESLLQSSCGTPVYMGKLKIVFFFLLASGKVWWLEHSPLAGGPGLDFLTELDQKTLKVGIHSFPA